MIRKRFGILVFLATALFSVAVLAQDGEIDAWDPIEPVNRGVFWFNDKADVYFLEPVADAYDSVIPDGVQRSVNNFFKNLEYPSNLVSNVVQFKFTQAAKDTGRFLINTTLGIGGLFDVASEFGLERHREDFGIALAYHGVPAGPYLVVPFIGPTNLRDGVGRIVDTFLHPFSLFTSDMDTGTRDKVVYGGIALYAIQSRADLLDAVKTAKESSLDYYLFTQGAYYQYRDGLLKDKATAQDDNIFNDETPLSAGAAQADPLNDE